MSSHFHVPAQFVPEQRAFTQIPQKQQIKKGYEDGRSLAAAITKAASQQTYYTIRFLVDRDRTADAYRAYAYFRWVDDQLDKGGLEQPDRLAFVRRQQALIKQSYQGEWGGELTAEEEMLVHLIHHDVEKHSGLETYIRYMMAVMAFDAKRKGQLVPQTELTTYSRWLATAVTEALHYFIGHNDSSPHGETRYLAVMAAHITHMLRDTQEDTAAGYFNIPLEWLQSQQITPQHVKSEVYRAWVKSRVQLARDYFRAGKTYLAQVQNLRCRLAGYAYIARFEGVLDTIEREGYYLRSAYTQGINLVSGLKMCLGILNKP